MHPTRNRLTTTQRLGISLFCGATHIIPCHLSELQWVMEENSLSKTIRSRRTCHDDTPHHPSGTKRIFKMNIEGKSCSASHNKICHLAISCWSLYPYSSWGYNNHTPQQHEISSWMESPPCRVHGLAIFGGEKYNSNPV